MEDTYLKIIPLLRGNYSCYSQSSSLRRTMDPRNRHLINRKSFESKPTYHTSPLTPLFPKGKDRNPLKLRMTLIFIVSSLSFLIFLMNINPMFYRGLYCERGWVRGYMDVTNHKKPFPLHPLGDKGIREFLVKTLKGIKEGSNCERSSILFLPCPNTTN